MIIKGNKAEIVALLRHYGPRKIVYTTLDGNVAKAAMPSLGAIFIFQHDNCTDGSTETIASFTAAFPSAQLVCDIA